VPVIPMALINGSDGIGNRLSTSSPPTHLRVRSSQNSALIAGESSSVERFLGSGVYYEIVQA
jgi:DNA gyrase/topoisomerase IV subunit A